jgi:S-adenosylmethionine synthetase
MAKLASQNIIIQLSRAVGNSEPLELSVLTPDTIAQLEAVISELVGDPSVIVDVLSDDS